MNVYDQAHGLAEAIRESGEFQEYDRLKNQLDQNPELAQRIHEIEAKQLEQQTKQMMGQTPDAEQMAALAHLTQLVMQEPLAAQYLQAAMRFSLMMNDVTQIIGDAIGLKTSLPPTNN